VEDFLDRGARTLSSSSSLSWSGLVKLPIDCARLISSFDCLALPSFLRLLRNGEFSLGVPDPPTKRETTSLPPLPTVGVPFWLLSGESGVYPEGVAVARDILVVFWECVRCRSRSVITFASAEWREACLSSEPFEVVTNFELAAGDCGGECDCELLALGFEDEWPLAGLEADLDKAGDALELAFSHASSCSPISK